MSLFPSQMPPATLGHLVGLTGSLAGDLSRMGDVVPVLPSGSAQTVVFDASATPGPPVETHISREPSGLGEHWFEIVHILPRAITLGNVLTNVTRTIDIYNASLRNTHALQAFINNAGAGTTITDLPSLPVNIPPQESLTLTLAVDADGAPTIDTTLDFEIDEPYLLRLPIQATRIVLFPFEPEGPFTERLLFLTDILEAKKGNEQRISLRAAPRQEFDLRLLRDDGPDRQRVEFLLFDWQNRIFGLPVWTEPSYLSAAASIGQTSVNVDTTATGDFRANGLAIVFDSESLCEAVEVESVGASSLNFKTALLNNYPVGARVMPLRTAITTEPAREKKWAVNLAEFSLTMRVLDNVDLSSTAGWPTHDGKVLLSDPNAIETTIDGSIARKIEVFDSAGVGKFSLGSTWNRARRTTAKTFITRTRAGLWSVRRLLHGLRGSQVSFYLPTFTKDVTLSSTYASGASALTIVNVGYTRYAKQRTPKVDIRVVLRNGTTYTRSITASAEVDALAEQITLNSSISQTITPDEIERIEFLEKVRIDNEEIVIEHRSSNGEAKISFPVKVVLE